MKTAVFFTICFFAAAMIYGQCKHIHIKGAETIDIAFNKAGRPTQMSGEDGQVMYLQVNDKGLTLPIPTGNEIAITNNADDLGSYILQMGAQGDDGFANNMTINPKGQIVLWYLNQATEEGDLNGIKITKYVYDSKGNLVNMSWEGVFQDTKVTDKGELHATFDLSKPDPLYSMGTARMFAEMNWTTFPMTNANLITGYAYTQKIHVPERQKLIGYDPKTHHEIYKTVPEINTEKTTTKTFTYAYDASGSVSEISVTENGKTEKLKMNYSEGKCEE